jgi:hypothetical protein
MKSIACECDIQNITLVKVRCESVLSSIFPEIMTDLENTLNRWTGKGKGKPDIRPPCSSGRKNHR